MNELYEKQKDGTFKPIKQPEDIAKKLSVYLWLRENSNSQFPIK